MQTDLKLTPAHFPSHQGKPSMRYFKNNSGKCEVCNESGHISLQCPRNLKKCIFCTDSAHSYYKCPETTCRKCGIPGHRLNSCQAGEPCAHCGVPGHYAKKCLARIEACEIQDLQKVKCARCGKKGHTNCNQTEGKEGFSRLHCFRCGLKGHDSDHCCKGDNKLELFRLHVKEAMSEFPEVHANMNCKERKYWDKVEKKAFKKLLKRSHRRKKKQSQKK